MKKNTAKTTGLAQTQRTHEGAAARQMTKIQELRRSVMACLLWENTFYESGEEIATRIEALAQELPVKVVADLAIEAREKMKLRHVPLWLVRSLAKRGGGRIVGDALYRVIQRADELTEFLALYWKAGKMPLAAQVKKGLARAFTKFDAYQLAKYNRDTPVKLRDVMFLTHPKPKDAEQEKIWKQLADGTLPSPGTWENLLSAGEDKKETWTKLLSTNKLGSMALLRNLRNMLEVAVDRDLICAALEKANFDRVLPFRFIAAATHAPVFEPELERAMLRSVVNLPKLPGKTALVVDHSASMVSRLSPKSDMNRFDAACGLAILLRELCDDIVIIAFSAPGINAAYKNYSLDRCMYNGFNCTGWPMNVNKPAIAIVPPRRGFALRDALRAATPWWGTHTEDGKCLADKEGYDRIIILTDEQSHQTISNPNGRGYVVNVAPYKNGIGYGKWIHIDGWSEAIATYISEIEREFADIQF